jgi:hypothetical protein
MLTYVISVTAIRKLGGQLPDRELAVTLNRMRYKPPDGKAWTTVRVRELRERLGIAASLGKNSCGGGCGVQFVA